MPAIRKVPQTMAAGSVTMHLRKVMMPSPPASAAPSRLFTGLADVEFSGTFSNMRRSDNDLVNAIGSVESGSASALTEFLALVPRDEWNAIAGWASQTGHSWLAAEASDFSNLLGSRRVVDLSEAQIREGIEILAQAVRLGYRLNRGILREARRRGLLAS
jgi:hypothetical protein